MIQKLAELVLNPTPEGAKSLVDEENLYLVTFNQYRLVYQVQKEASLITVAKVAHLQDY